MGHHPLMFDVRVVIWCHVDAGRFADAGDIGRSAWVHRHLRMIRGQAGLTREDDGPAAASD